LLLHGVDSPEFRRLFPGTEPPARVSDGRFEGVAANVLRRYAERIEDTAYREKTERLLVKEGCPDCRGERLRPESRQVTVAGTTITEAQRLPLSGLAEWIGALPGRLGAEERAVAEPVVADLAERLHRLAAVGVGYLTLDQAAPPACPRARPSGCGWPRCSAPGSPGCSTCSTSRRWACTPPTPSGSSGCCTGCATSATRCWSSSTTRRCCAPPTTSSTSAREPAATAGASSPRAPPPRWPRSPNRSPAATSAEPRDRRRAPGAGPAAQS